MELDELLRQAVGSQGIGGTVGGVSSIPTVLPSRKPPAPYIAPPRHESGPNKGIGKVSYSHDALIDLILANPFISQNELARISGYSVSWLSQVKSSDAFQVRLAERQGEAEGPWRTDRDAMFKAMLDRSSEILAEKLQAPSNVVSDQLVLRTYELSARAIGYGARDPSVVINQNNISTSIDLHLEKMGEGLTKLLRRRKGELIEQQSAEEG